jgi:hypothetical protein
VGSLSWAQFGERGSTLFIPKKEVVMKLNMEGVRRFFSIRGIGYTYGSDIFAAESWHGIEAMHDYLSNYFHCVNESDTFECERCYEVYLLEEHRVGMVCKACVEARPDVEIEELFFYIESHLCSGTLRQAGLLSTWKLTVGSG